MLTLLVRKILGFLSGSPENPVGDSASGELTTDAQRSLYVRATHGPGIVDEVTLSASDIDMTKDPHGTNALLGPCNAVEVIAGAGSLIYVTPDGVQRTLTNLSVGDSFEGILMSTYKTGSGVTGLRVRWT